jgi:hypothetical protein
MNSESLFLAFLLLMAMLLTATVVELTLWIIDQLHSKF